MYDRQASFPFENFADFRANGLLGRRFKELHPGVQWWGVDVSADAVAAASHLAAAWACGMAKASAAEGVTRPPGIGRLAVRVISAADVPLKFGFVARPVQPAGEAECY